MEQLLSCKTASIHYSYSEHYFRKLIFELRVPFEKIGRQVRFKKSDLDEWFELKKTYPNLQKIEITDRTKSLTESKK